MRRTTFFLCFSLVLFLAVSFCRRESPEITERDLRSYVGDLSRTSLQGRESGTRFSRQAAFYIARRYQEAGLFPAFTPKLRQKPKGPPPRSYLDPKDDPVLSKSSLRDFIQPFGFRAGIEFEASQNRIKFYASQGKKELSLRALPFPVAHPDELSGELIFGGFCLEAPKKGWNDFARFQAKGKILLCLRHGPGGDQDSRFRAKISFQAKWRAAKKHGAVGLVFLGREGFPLPSIHQFRPQMREGPVAIFLSHRRVFDRYPFLKKDYEQMLAGKPASQIGALLGRVHLRTAFSARAHRAYNVGAYLRRPRGNPEAAERLLILGAHLDHLGRGYFSSRGTPGRLHLGADDNASGTAAVLELALAFAHERERLSSRVNLLFLHFDGEERGLLGSRYFVDSGFFPGLTHSKTDSTQQRRPVVPRRAEAMINLDMVGRLRKTKGLMVQGCETADSRWADILSQGFEKAFGSGALAASRPGSPEASRGGCGSLASSDGTELRLIKGGTGPSDHSPFYRKKLPIAFFFTGSHQDYHTERDVPERVHYAGLLRIVRMVHSTVLLWADLSRPLEYRKAPHEARRADFDFHLRLGIVPGSYETGTDGLLVEAVKEDAPVAKSGLQAGDVVVRIGETRIRDIDDLMEFLSNASSEKLYELHYKRKGTLHKTQTRLMAR